MTNDKLVNIEASSEKKNPTLKLKEITEIKELNLGNSAGFVCDIDTGICSPANNRKED